MIRLPFVFGSSFHGYKLWTDIQVSLCYFSNNCKYIDNDELQISTPSNSDLTSLLKLPSLDGPSDLTNILIEDKPCLVAGYDRLLNIHTRTLLC